MSCHCFVSIKLNEWTKREKDVDRYWASEDNRMSYILWKLWHRLQYCSIGGPKYIFCIIFVFVSVPTAVHWWKGRMGKSRLEETPALLQEDSGQFPPYFPDSVFCIHSNSPFCISCSREDCGDKWTFPPAAGSTVVNCPTRWSLLFIFVFLCWSSIFPIPDTKKYSTAMCYLLARQDHLSGDGKKIYFSIIMKSWKQNWNSFKKI